MMLEIKNWWPDGENFIFFYRFRVLGFEHGFMHSVPYRNKNKIKIKGFRWSEPEVSKNYYIFEH